MAFSTRGIQIEGTEHKHLRHLTEQMLDAHGKFAGIMRVEFLSWVCLSGALFGALHYFSGKLYRHLQCPSLLK